MFRRLEFSEYLSLESIKSEYLGKKEDVDTILSLFEKYNNDFRSQVEINKSVATLQKYENSKRHFRNFLESKYGHSVSIDTLQITGGNAGNICATFVASNLKVMDEFKNLYFCVHVCP